MVKGCLQDVMVVMAGVVVMVVVVAVVMPVHLSNIPCLLFPSMFFIP